MKRNIQLLLLLVLSTTQLQAQDLTQYKRVVKTLSSAKYQGRGYAKRHVPCIFLENEEGDAFKYYHTIYDNWQHAVFDSYEPVFRLVTNFIERY